jgi:hypothetical protein
MTSSVVRVMMNCVAVIGTWPAFGILILLCLVLFGYLVPKAKAPIFANIGTTLPHKVLDEYFPSWTPQIADNFLAAIGPDGRAAYRRFYLTMDFWFPGAMASLTIASLLLIAFPPASRRAWLCVIAAPSWLFDAAENITHFRMAGSFPNLSPSAVRLGPFFTRAKWVFAILPLPVAMVGIIFRFFHDR